MVLTVTTTFEAPNLARPISSGKSGITKASAAHPGVARVVVRASALAPPRRRESSRIRGRDVLELGAGVGAVGLVCASWARGP